MAQEQLPASQDGRLPLAEEAASALPEVEVAQHIGVLAADEQVPRRRRGLITRRRLLGLGAAATGALATAGWWVHHQAEEVNHAQTSINSMLNEIILGMMTNNQFKEAAAQCGDPEIDLDYEQSLVGDAESALTLFEAAFGTSNNFRKGLDSYGRPNLPKPFHQPNSTTEIGASSLEDQALATLRIVEIITRVFAHPGAYSGDGPYPGTDVGATDSMISGQLNYTDPATGYDFQAELRQTTAKPIMRVEGGYDDYRVLFASVAQLASRLSDVTRLATSPNIDRDMQREVSAFVDAMGKVAGQFGQNLIKFADNLADANEYRLQRGLMRITMETVFTWNFVRQRFFPFGAIDGDNSPLLNNPLLGRFMQADPTGPPNLNRYMVDMLAMPGNIGPKLAFIAWGMIVERQIDALHIIEKKHPRLHRVVTDLIDLNKSTEFYKSEVYDAAVATATAQDSTTQDVEVLDQGDGHPGGVTGKRAGAEQIALAGLAGRRRRVGATRRRLSDYSSIPRRPVA